MHTIQIIPLAASLTAAIPAYGKLLNVEDQDPSKVYAAECSVTDIKPRDPSGYATKVEIKWRYDDDWDVSGISVSYTLVDGHIANRADQYSKTNVWRNKEGTIFWDGWRGGNHMVGTLDPANGTYVEVLTIPAFFFGTSTVRIETKCHPSS